MDALRHDFARAGLALELRTVPLAWDRGEGTEAIVQMDIARDERRRTPEWFRIYPGHASNQLEVLGFDPSQRQLVLRVEEAERGFAVRQSATTPMAEDAIVVRRDRRFVWVAQRTSARERRFLCGMDEQHLFIALLPEPVGTVAAAHACLRDPRVDEAERRAGTLAIRQGEWFFVPLSAEDEQRIDVLARRSLPVRRRVGIAEGSGIRRIGREHVVDELLVTNGIPDTSGDTSRRVYVRGAVRHPDHGTVLLRAWHLSVPNREELAQPVPGVDWVD